MTALLDRLILPESGPVQINYTFDINITAKDAQRKVNGWLVDEVSHMIGAQEPTLVINQERTVWRVPAIYTVPHIGEVGVAGTVDVDIQTGVLQTSLQLKEAILEKAEMLAETVLPYTCHEEISEKYLATNIQPTSTKSQGCPLEIIANVRQHSVSHRTTLQTSLN